MAQTVLITGASDGIGLRLARLLTAEGMRVIGIGRRPPQEREFQSDVGEYIPLDLADVEAARRVSDLLREGGVERLDFLIHNAAIAYYGPIAEQSSESIEQLVEVNLAAPIALTQRLLPLVERAAGRVVFISSMTACLPSPDYAVYSACKASLDGFARNIRAELAGRVTVQSIHPGGVSTDMHDKVGFPVSSDLRRRFLSVDEAARRIAVRLRRRQRQACLQGPHAALFWAARRFPSAIDRSSKVRAPLRGGKLGGGKGGHCLITGAAGGIGRSLLRRFSSGGLGVTGLDRNRDPSRQVKGEGTSTTSAPLRWIIADLADPGLVEEAALDIRRGPPLDVLIHNAGINQSGRFEELAEEEWRRLLRVNFLAPMLLTARLLEFGHLKADSRVVLISSLSHYVSYPGAAVYACAKDGLAAYGRSLAAGASPSRPGVLTVFPGPTRTRQARLASPDNSRENRRMSPDELAERIWKALRRGRRRLVPGWPNRLIGAVGRHFPRLTESLMRKAIYEKLP